jgi:hypothetical protein
MRCMFRRDDDDMTCCIATKAIPNRRKVRKHFEAFPNNMFGLYFTNCSNHLCTCTKCLARDAKPWLSYLVSSLNVKLIASMI